MFVEQDANFIEARAKKANSPDLWDKIWKTKESSEWRKEALSQVYVRIARNLPRGKKVIDLGGGIGDLAQTIKNVRGVDVEVWEHSSTAIETLSDRGIASKLVDLESYDWSSYEEDAIIVSTEVIEHLSEKARDGILSAAKKTGISFISVPNDRLDPEDEHQHTCSFTPFEFKKYLEQYFQHVRVEVLGPFLLGVCGFKKNYTLSVTSPARDEAEDINVVLASFMGIADEIVVGVDPRTQDNTEEVVRKYTDKVFYLVDPEGPPEGPADQIVPKGGVNFSWVRNQCIERCTSDWVFMTEAHERLWTGHDILLSLDSILPTGTKVVMVGRNGNKQRWMFPWLFKNDTRIRFKRPTHNVLDFPEEMLCVKLPAVNTLHERVKEREKERAKQRKIQNRLSLFEDWLNNENENSLYYLGCEWREHDENRALKYLEQLLLLPSRDGFKRYQCRLVVAKMYMLRKDYKRAREVLIRAAEDDWSRTEHWVWLGDLAFNEEKYEEALHFYKYGAVLIGQPPATQWWIDMYYYSYLPAQRLAMTYAILGKYEESLFWAEKVRELLPDDAPLAVFEEVQGNIDLIRQALEGPKE